MANFGTSINNLTYSVVNGAMNHGMGFAMDWLQGKWANGGRDKKVRFYYNEGAGGGIVQVMTNAVIGGAVAELKDLAVNEFKSLFKDKKGSSIDIGSVGWNYNALEAQVREESQNYGAFPVNNGSASVFAIDDWGARCYDALMLGIPVEQPISVSQDMVEEEWSGYGSTARQTGIRKRINNVQSDHLVWYDCTALVNINSDKNLVVTPVQGRDYSRKELVSNGDIVFSISGTITSRYPDIYPSEEVLKLRKILQYKGLIEVNNQTINEWGITKIGIKDFSMPQSEGYNSRQTYSFSAIGIQPEGDREVSADTLRVLVRPFETKVDSDNPWNDLLQDKLDALKNMSIDAVDQGAALASGALLNKL